jgi:pimeloyl-ACP methyl ester carboxylesterase
MIGHETFGSGPQGVVVLNDWIGDTSTWDPARAYLDVARFTWAFTDVRGYGRSRGQTGAFTVEEMTADVIALADHLAWPTFAIVGHSMSSLVALHLAQHHADRVARAIVVAPPPPAGFGADDARLDALRTIGRGEDDAMRMRWLRGRLGERWSEGWVRFKAERWRAAADPKAVAAYAEAFARRGLPDRAARIACPLFALTCDQDIDVMRRDAVTSLLAPLADRLVVEAIGESGHYPMQETPPRFVAIVERFLTC